MKFTTSPRAAILPRIVPLALLFFTAVASGFAASEVTPTTGSPQETVTSAPRKEVKLLTVGNSFAWDATTFLPKLAELNGKELTMVRANLGGCSLERHVRHLTAYDANPGDPEGSPYKGPLPGYKQTMYSLKEALLLTDWDYITIQQVSNLSYLPETYEPYASTLINYIHTYAPKAQIVIHQTWAYREDYADFKDGFTQKVMYEKSRAAYHALATKYGNLPIIPVGDAIQAARSTPLWSFAYPDPAFDYKNPPAGKIPAQRGSLNAGWAWRTDPKNGKTSFGLDFKHCNTAGKYLGSLVFYECIYGEAPKAPFVPQGVTPEEAESLTKIAHDTVKPSAVTKDVASLSAEANR
jgi:hypothetical protein